MDIDSGEASVIALTVESERSLLILDDNKGRKTAKRLNLSYTGSPCIFLKAKQLGIIQSVKLIIEKIQLTNFRYSKLVLNEILLLADES